MPAVPSSHSIIPNLTTVTNTLARASLTTDSAKHYVVPLQTVRSNTGLVLTATTGATLFTVSNGGYGVGTLLLLSENANNNTKTDTLCFEFGLPIEYVAASAITLRVTAKYTENGTVGTKTLDAECYLLSTSGTVGADLVSTTIKTLTTSFVAYDFTVTPTSRAAGDKLIFFVQGIIQESAGGGNDFISIGGISVGLDVKG